MATVDITNATTDNATVPATEAPVKHVSEPTMNGCDKKEEETSTPAPTTTANSNANSKSDDNQNTTTQTAEELLSAGTKLISEEKYNEAADILSSAMTVIQEKNIANTIESVKYYMAYGEALLRLVQSSNDLFAAPVRESQQQHLAEMQQEEEEDDDVDIAEAQPIADATANDKSEESKTEKSGNSKEEQEDDEDVDIKQTPINSKEEADDAEPEAAPAAPDGDVDTSDDREYAWESFEYARGIIEEYLNKDENKGDDKDNDEYLKLLASSHAFLGELLIEDERNEDALTEFNKAIEIQNKCKKDVIKVRSRASNHFMACLAAQFADKDEQAVKHCDAALQGLTQRVSQLLTQFGCTESVEMKENDYTQIIKVAEDFMDDKEKFNEDKVQSEDGKEMKDLVGVMGDLCAKLDEVKEIIQLKKDGKYGNAAPTEGIVNGDGASGFDQQLAMDPLQALISGLTSKFGIDEEQLAAMAAEEDGDDENKNTSNKNVTMPSGVTTIGFGNVEPVNDDEVNDLDLCVKRKKKDEDKEKKTMISGKKRKMEDADIDDMEEVNGAAKKMKLNSGDAKVAVDNNNEDGK